MQSVDSVSDKIVLSKGRVPLDIGIMFLVFGLIFFPLGLFALGKVVIATFDILLGRDFEGNFLLGLVIAIGFMGLGGLAIWVFTIPSEDLFFDGSAETLTSVRSYPFGHKKTEVVPLGELDTPEVHWQQNLDRSEDGFWCLRITLPSGRRFDYEPPAHSVARQKQAAETLRDNILDLT